MSTKRSPFTNKNISARKVYKSCVKYFNLTGEKITFDLEKPGKIGLYLPNGRFIGRWSNWEAYTIIENMIQASKDQKLVFVGGEDQTAVFIVS